MKNPIRLSITLAGAVLCALPNLAMAQSGRDDSQGDQGTAIEGTWIVTVDRLPQNVQFSAFQSFTAGGVVLAAGTLDRQPPPPLPPSPQLPPYTSARSALYGSWARVDNKTYAVTLNLFIFDAQNNAMVMFQNNQTIKVTGNHLVGVGTACTWTIVAGIIQMPPTVPSGVCTPVPGSITITGTRLIAQGP